MLTENCRLIRRYQPLFEGVQPRNGIRRRWTLYSLISTKVRGRTTHGQIPDHAQSRLTNMSDPLGVTDTDHLVPVSRSTAVVPDQFRRRLVTRTTSQANFTVNPSAPPPPPPPEYVPPLPGELSRRPTSPGRGISFTLESGASGSVMSTTTNGGRTVTSQLVSQPPKASKGFAAAAAEVEQQLLQKQQQQQNGGSQPPTLQPPPQALRQSIGYNPRKRNQSDDSSLATGRPPNDIYDADLALWPCWP